MSIKSVVFALPLAAILLSVPASTSAQQIGIKGGINFATITPEEDDDPEPSRRRGPIGGVWVNTPLGSRLSLQVEALFSEKGMEIEIPEIGLDYAKLRLHYLEVPVLARFAFGEPVTPTRVFVVGGLAPAFELGARSTVSIDGEVRSQRYGDQIKPFDLGLVGGIGVEFGRVAVEGRYTHGLLHINEDDNGDDRIRNRVFSVIAGFRFR